MRKTKKSLALKKIAELPKPEKLIANHKREFIAGILGFVILAGLLVYFIRSLDLSTISVPGTILATPSAALSSTPSPKEAEYYILKEGESLWDVAGKEYGDPYLYPTIVELNKLESPDYANPGTRIKVR